MAWFRNYYKCERCGSDWTDEWSCMCDDDCPEYRSRHYSPYKSDDLTYIIVCCGRQFVVLRSPETAEDFPSYLETGSFRTKRAAKAYLASHSNDE